MNGSFLIQDLKLMYRLLYDQNSPTFWQSVIKYWKIVVCNDLNLVSALFLGNVEKCAISGMLGGQGHKGHQTFDCVLFASFISTETKLQLLYKWFCSLRAVQYFGHESAIGLTVSCSFEINLFCNLKVLPIWKRLV